MNTTRSEKLLALILAGFVVIALSWAYVNIADGVRDSRYAGTVERSKPIEAAQQAHFANEKRLGLTGRLSDWNIDSAQDRLYELRGLRDSARERYRTAVEGNKPNQAELELKYKKLDERAVENGKTLKTRRRSQGAAQRTLKAYDQSQAGKIRELNQRAEGYDSSTDRRIFALRVLAMFGFLALSLLLLRRVTERRPRALALAHAVVGGAAILALTLIIDYSEVSFDFDSVGPLGLSALGAALTIACFVALQRYMRTQRPARRLRAHECAACGYPAGNNRHCEGCGAAVLTDCGACGEPRRVGVAHCGGCGEAVAGAPGLAAT